VPHGLALLETLDLLCIADRENLRVVCTRAGLGPYPSAQSVSIRAPDLGRVFGVAAAGGYMSRRIDTWGQHKANRGHLQTASGSRVANSGAVRDNL
jgi:hypothetical protein